MKPNHFPRLLALLLLSFTFFYASASVPGGSVMGQIIDPNTKQPVDGAFVVFESKGTQKVFTTNENGYYYASNIPAGVYKVTVSFMGKTNSASDVTVINDGEATLDIPLSISIEMKDIPIVFERDVLIDPLNPTTTMVDHKKMQEAGVLTVSATMEVFGGGGIVRGADGNYYVQGARAGGLVYVLDGCRIMGSPDVPASSLDTYRSFTHFIPAKYGDTTGGIVVMETRNYFSEQY